jgi:hypothetical protein
MKRGEKETRPESKGGGSDGLTATAAATQPTPPAHPSHHNVHLSLALEKMIKNQDPGDLEINLVTVLDCHFDSLRLDY